jgi:hypothetical protein
MRDVGSWVLPPANDTVEYLWAYLLSSLGCVAWPQMAPSYSLYGDQGSSSTCVEWPRTDLAAKMPGRYRPTCVQWQMMTYDDDFGNPQ